MAFDGVNIWVSNFGSNTVTKLLASGGQTLGTFAVGGHPDGVAFDSANVFGVGTQPIGVAFDGANIWVVNSASNSVSKL